MKNQDQKNPRKLTKREIESVKGGLGGSYSRISDEGTKGGDVNDGPVG